MGHAKGRPERVEFMERISKEIKNVRLYGKGWNIPGSVTVTGVEHIQAMRAGKIHVNFPGTRSGYTNVKCGVFETVASGGILCTEHFDEMTYYFSYDDEIIGYTDSADLSEQLKSLVVDSNRIETIKRKAFARLAKEHLYEHRWLDFFEELERRTGESIELETTRRKCRVVITGFYGSQNTGDELILKSFAQNLAGPKSPYKLVVAAENTDNVTKEHALSAFARKDVNRGHAEVSAASAVILGGGGLWHDYTFVKAGGLPGLFSSNSISITGYSKLPLMARVHGRPFHVYGMGVGPLNDPEAKQYVRFLATQADSVVVRDESSREQLLEIEEWHGQVYMVPDPVYALDISDAKAPKKVLEFAKNRAVIGINLRPWKYHDEKAFVARVVTVLKTITEEKNIAFLGLPFQHPQDDRILKQVFDKLPAAIPRMVLVTTPGQTGSQIIGSIKCCQLVFAMRLHACLLAHRLEVPAVGLSYDPKVRATFNQIGAPELVLPLDARAPAIASTIIDALNNADRHRADAKPVIQRLETEARSGFHKLLERLDNAPTVNTPILTPLHQPTVLTTQTKQVMPEPLFYFSIFNEDISFNSDTWKNLKTPAAKQWSLTRSDTGKLDISFEFEPGKHSYIKQDSIRFDAPPASRKTAQIDSNRSYCLKLNCSLSGPAPRVELWVIEYNAKERLCHSRKMLKNGSNLMEFDTGNDTTLFRLAIRFSGHGRAELGTISLFKKEQTITQ
jgi:polysaccharide pyruvyl transferase CsaB